MKSGFWLHEGGRRTDNSEQGSGRRVFDRGGGLHFAGVPPLRGRRAADGAEENIGHSGRDDDVGEEYPERAG